MKINDRWILMILIAGGQLACLMGALCWFVNWLNAGLVSQLRDQVLASNEQYVGQAVDTIRRMRLADVRPGSSDWDHIQTIIERTKLPNDGFLCIIDSEEGRLLCHPEVRQNPILLSMQPGQTQLQGPHGGERIMDAAQGDSVACGWAEMPDGMHLIAIRDIPELKVKVIAHQRERGIAQILTTMSTSLWKIGLLVGLILVGATAMLTALIIRRYENKLADLNTGLELQVQRRSRSLMKTRDAVIFGLARLAESRHEDTGEHLERIHLYVEILARELAKTSAALDEEMVSTIAVASSLHDIGKVGIPDEVLLKPGKLTPRQRAVMRRHTIIGGDCLLAIRLRLGDDDFLTTACQIALSHHERWNGTGYPFGLVGDQIPFAGRIVALADVYDALTSDRIYKCAMSHERARRAILAGAGKQFDPAIVDAFLRREAEFERISGESRRLSEPLMAAA